MQIDFFCHLVVRMLQLSGYGINVNSLLHQKGYVGVPFQKKLAAKDERTCDICGGYHEKIYPIEEFFLCPESRKVGNAMKAVCIKSYYAKRLKRQAAVGDELF